MMILIKNCFQELEQWDKWEENPVVVIPDKPVNTIQAKIDQYRQQANKPPETSTEEQLNFFQVIPNNTVIFIKLEKCYLWTLCRI